METGCSLFTNLYKNHKALFEPGESAHKTDCQTAASNQMARCYNRAIMQVQMIAFKNMRCIAIRQSTINRVPICKEFDVCDFKRHRTLVERRICVVKFKFKDKTS